MSAEAVRRLIAIEFVSLDGVIQSPGRRDEDTSGGFVYGGWIAPYVDPALSSIIRKQMDMPFDLVLGRTTFDIWAPYWPQHVDVWPGVDTATKYVVSHATPSRDWQPSVWIGEDVARRIASIKQQAGPDLHVYGSANLLQTLLAHDLVDALWLRVFPITLGGGKRLFADGAIPAAFEVRESTVTPKGVIVVDYERAGPITTAS